MQQGPTRTEISPRHHTATNKLEFEHISMICTSFGMWSIGLAKPHPHPQGFTYDNTSCSTSFARGLLAQPSLTHTLKDLPLPPPPQNGQQGMTCRTVPLLHVVFWPYRQRPHPHTQGFTRVIQSVSLQSDFLSPRHGNHQHHSTRAKPYQKPRSSMHSKYIVYFQVVS